MGIGTSTARRLHVLVVEDDGDTRDALVRLVDELGHRVDAAATGARAIELAVRFRPDVVVLDLWMPEINGTDIVRQIRQRTEKDRTPVIVAYSGDQKELGRIREAGCDYVVLKPDVNGLIVALNDAAAERIFTSSRRR